MDHLDAIFALVGLAGAVNNNGKTANTDTLVREALRAETTEDMITRIREEKYVISPNCRTCPSPCGNTSDYDPVRWDQATAEEKEAKQKVIEALRVCVAHVAGELPPVVYKAISYLGYGLEAASYLRLLEELTDCIVTDSDRRA